MKVNSVQCTAKKKKNLCGGKRNKKLVDWFLLAALLHIEGSSQGGHHFIAA